MRDLTQGAKIVLIAAPLQKEPEDKSSQFLNEQTNPAQVIIIILLSTLTFLDLLWCTWTRLSNPQVGEQLPPRNPPTLSPLPSTPFPPIPPTLLTLNSPATLKP